MDGIYHVLRLFEDPEISHVENNVDPIRDLQIIYDELILKDLEFLQKRLSEVETKIMRYNDGDAKEEKETLDLALALLKSNKWISSGTWTSKNVEILNKYTYLTAKPMIYLLNLSEEDFVKKKNKWLKGVKDWITENHPG